jgi:hypothetical protein
VKHFTKRPSSLGLTFRISPWINALIINLLSINLCFLPRLAILKSNLNSDNGRCSCDHAAEVFNPHSDLSIIRSLTLRLVPESGPEIMLNYSLIFPYKNIISISHSLHKNQFLSPKINTLPFTVSNVYHKVFKVLL